VEDIRDSRGVKQLVKLFGGTHRKGEIGAKHVSFTYAGGSKKPTKAVKKKKGKKASDKPPNRSSRKKRGGNPNKKITTSARRASTMQTAMKKGNRTEDFYPSGIAVQSLKGSKEKAERIVTQNGSVGLHASSWIAQRIHEKWAGESTNSPKARSMNGCTETCM